MRCQASGIPQCGDDPTWRRPLVITQSFLRTLFLSIAGLATAVAGFIGVVDPYGVSPVNLSLPGVNIIKPFREKLDRKIKPYEVWRYQPKSVFLGTSRFQQAINPRALDGTDFAPAYNSSVPAATPGENV